DPDARRGLGNGLRLGLVLRPGDGGDDCEGGEEEVAVSHRHRRGPDRGHGEGRSRRAGGVERLFYQDGGRESPSWTSDRGPETERPIVAAVFDDAKASRRGRAVPVDDSPWRARPASPKGRGPRCL